MLKKDLKIASIVILCLGVLLFMFIGFFNFMTSLLLGGTVSPKNYSKRQVQQLVKTLIPDSNYIKRKKVKEVVRDDYYLYKDSYGREFIIESTSIEYPLIYIPRVFNGYEGCIFQKNINEIEAVLDDTGLEYKIYDKASKMQDDMLKWAIETPSLSPPDIHINGAKEEDIMLIATAFTKIDEILKYNYNRECESEIDYDNCYGGNVSIYFGDWGYMNEADFKFSTSESERWTAESLYEYIQKQYQQNLKKIKRDEEKKQWEEEQQQKKKEEMEKLKRTLPIDIANYLSEKYDETFIIDEQRPVWISDTNDEVYLELYCERIPEILITVRGKKNADGTFDFTDDFEEGKRYKDND